MSTARRATLVVNAHSRSGAKLLRRAQRALTAQGVDIEAAHGVERPERLAEHVRDAIAGGAKLVVVGGGDGTIASVVDDFMGTDVVLGLLPLGTANSFARDLGVPLDLDGAVATIARGREVEATLAIVNDDAFSGTATIGLAPAVARATPKLLKRVAGRAAYGVVGAIQFLRLRPFKLWVTEGGETQSFDALQLLIANGRYFGGVVVAPDADAQSPRVVVQIVTGRSRWALLRAWAAVALGKPGGSRGVVELQLRDAVIETAPPQWVSVDGEVSAKTPLHLHVAPRAIRVLVP